MLTRFLAALAALSMLAACGPVLVADDARKRELIMRQHVDLWSRGDLDLIDELFSEDFVGHFPGALVEGRRSLRAYVASQREAHADWSETVETVLVEGTRGASRVVLQGSRAAELLGTDAGNRMLAIEQGVFFEFERGRISRQWVFADPTQVRQVPAMLPAD